MKTNLMIIKFLLSFVFCLSATATIAIGQETTGKIEGFVKDSAGAVVPSVTVTITSATSVNSGTTTTGTRPVLDGQLRLMTKVSSVFCKSRPETIMWLQLLQADLAKRDMKM